MPAQFTPELFLFLRELKAHNTRDWFEAHRERYVADVEKPMLAFIEAFRPALSSISPAFVADARRMGGSMYRIYRDTRFSADKTPYKTHVAATFPHKDRRKFPHVPGFYLHLEPGDCMGGGGIYHPDMPTLTRIRQAIVDEGKAWSAVKRGGLAIEGETLKRAPAGFDANHKFVEDLRRKDFYSIESFSQKDACAADFLDRYLDSCRRVAPLVAFLTRAIGLTW